jgi:prepilin-type N-terminal cleavage/methylation domain-containing protein
MRLSLPASFLSRSLSSDRFGFTMIEMLIVVAVTAMLSSFLLLYNSTSRQQVALFVERAKMSQVMQKAKSFSIASYATTEEACGYGVEVDYITRSYFIFRYAKPAASSCEEITIIGTSENDPNIQPLASYTYELNSALVFDRPDDAIESVLFIPPDPRVLVRTGDIILRSGGIYMATRDHSATASVLVGVAGQISI